MHTKQRYNPQTVGTPVEDISQQDIVRRFIQLHQLRLEHVQRFVQPKQHVFLELLALLFHQNIPLLPGFISTDTPFGLANYAPDVMALAAVKKFSQGYRYANVKLQRYPIDAIFLMGSVSSMAFSDNSDMDVWVCHQTDLTLSERQALKRKADSIEKWAVSLGLEVHFFLIDSVQFLQGQSTPISTESSGQLQHYLLLEEFYRTAIYVAGKVPAWWLVPPHEEKNYTAYLQHLQKQRFVQERDIIDFGGLDNVPAEEFISATLWHLYKALYAPHKSLLKLLLMECYASEYPHSDWLCVHLKQAVYEGIVDIDELDPYLLIYRKIDAYLQDQPKRLLFARHCFYLKIMGSPSIKSNHSSRLKTSDSHTLRSTFIQKVAEYWQWPDYLIPELSDDKNWTINKANWEYEIIQNQLQQSYRIIQGFTKKYTQGNSTNNDLELIRRKLRASLSPKPGKVDIISTQSSVRVVANELSLVENSTPYGGLGWSLFSGKVTALTQAEHQPIKRTDSYLEALAWMVVNGVYHKRITLTVDAQSITLPSVELYRIGEHIQQLFNSHSDVASHSLDAYRAADAGVVTLAFINLGHTEVIERHDGKLVISQQSDALSYGVNHQCLIQTIDSITLSKWGEITINRYLGLEGLFDYFIDTLNALSKPLHSEQLQLACYASVRANTIMHRINAIFQQLCHVFSQPEQLTTLRYILAGGSAYYCIQYQDAVFSYWEMPTKMQLFKALGEQNSRFTQTVFDAELQLKSIIPTLYGINQPHKIQLFYLSNANNITVYLLDEKGALFMQQHLDANIDQVLNSYSVFLDAVIHQYFSDIKISVEYYAIVQSPGKALRCQRMNLNTLSPYQKLDIRISAQRNDDKSIRYCLYCNGETFSSLDYGTAVFSHAAHHIMQYRRSNEHYPIHISDVDVPLVILGVTSLAQLQSIHLLQFKQKIESRLIA
ncbi:MAG: class I adenylate cyclase [Methylococcaceae bacterium]